MIHHDLQLLLFVLPLADDGSDVLDLLSVLLDLRQQTLGLFLRLKQNRRHYPQGLLFRVQIVHVFADLVPLCLVDVLLLRGLGSHEIAGIVNAFQVHVDVLNHIRNLLLLENRAFRELDHPVQFVDALLQLGVIPRNRIDGGDLLLQLLHVVQLCVVDSVASQYVRLQGHNLLRMIAHAQCTTALVEEGSSAAEDTMHQSLVQCTTLNAMERHF